TEDPWRLILWLGHISDRLVSLSDDGSMRLWAMGRLSDRISMPGPNGTAGWNVIVLPGQEIAKFPCYGRDEKGGVTRGEFAAFSPYGHWLATTYNDKVSFRSPKDGHEQFAWNAGLANGQRIMAIRFDPDGNTLLAFLENVESTQSANRKFLQYDLDRQE